MDIVVKETLECAQQHAMENVRQQQPIWQLVRRHYHHTEPKHGGLLPAEMRQVLVTWLLVAKRRRVARYVALLVCSFIVTK
jgi:hypothetical protein